jgi:nucleotide-binding universal stress UspA family protein
VFQRVVVGLDDTPLSERLLDYAAAFAGAFGARVTLLHTFNWSERFAMVDAPAIEAVTEGPEREAAAAREFLEERAWPLRQRGLNVETVVVDAPAAEAIVEQSRQEPGTLVVLGTRERGWLSRLVQGSTSDEVLGQIETPLLILREGAERHPVG